MAIYKLLLAHYHSRKHVTSHTIVMSKSPVMKITPWILLCICNCISACPCWVCCSCSSFYCLQLCFVLIFVTLESIKRQFSSRCTVLLSWSVIIACSLLRKCKWVLSFACYLACHVMLLLCDATAHIYKHVHLITYSCVDMCEHTYQYGSCDHPKQTLLWCSAILLTSYDCSFMPV